MKVIIAIDPGVSGGIAVHAFGKTHCHAMPETQGDRLEAIRSLKSAADLEHADCECVLEQVGGFIGKGQPGSAMFKFGEQFGFLKGVIQALGIRLVLVRPQEWQKPFGLGTAASCASQREWKNKLKAEAQRRFPHLAVTLKTADALLMLEWATGEKQRAEMGAEREARRAKSGSSYAEATEDGGQGTEDGGRTTDDGAHGVMRPT